MPRQSMSVTHQKVYFYAEFRKVGARGNPIGKPLNLQLAINLPITEDETGAYTADYSEVEHMLLNQHSEWDITYKGSSWRLMETINFDQESVEKEVQRMSKLNQLWTQQKKQRQQELQELREAETKVQATLEVIERNFPNRFVSSQSKLDMARGNPYSVSNGGVNLGRNFNKYSYLVFLNGNEKVAEEFIPKGNNDNYGVVGEGEHPELGKWIETVCSVDSGD